MLFITFLDWYWPPKVIPILIFVAAVAGVSCITYRLKERGAAVACLIAAVGVCVFSELLMFAGFIGIISIVTGPASLTVIFGIIIGWLAKYIANRKKNRTD